MAKKIQILGAGLSGMIAGIDLVRHDYEVTIIEAAAGLGGRGNFHPSTHATPLDRDAAWKYIGLDLSQGFRPAKLFRVYFGEQGYDLDPNDLYIVERGARENSLDSMVYREAQKLGVKFEFNQMIKKHTDLPPGSIIATGLFPEMFHALGVPTIEAYGWANRQPMEGGPACVVYFDSYIGDYYYSSTTNGLLFSMLFQRTDVPRADMERCQDFLRRHEKLECKDWFHCTNWIPVADAKNPRLFAGDKILAGTLAGMMDPMFLFGINGAVLSGRIAARAVYEPDQAQKDFAYYSRNYARNYRAQKIQSRIPAWLKIRLGRRMLTLPKSLLRNALDPDKLGIPGVKEFNLFDQIKKL